MGDDRWQAMLHYMDHLAGMHRIPVEKFAHIRGMGAPGTASDIALKATERMYRYGAASGIIDAPLEFLQSWLRRNVPEHRTTPRFITGDAGQFMAAGTEVAGLLDFEIATIGDTHWDLACFRGRHPYEDMGDIPALYRRYAEASGEEVDLRVVGYHTVNFMQLSSIAALTFMDPETIGANWIEGVFEYCSITRRGLEADRRAPGPEARLRPAPCQSPRSSASEDAGLRKLVVDVGRLPTSTAFAPWERDLLGAIPSFLLNHARFRDWFERESAADVGQLTGRTYPDLAAADADAMEIIASGDPGRDEELARIMHRRVLRFLDGHRRRGSEPTRTFSSTDSTRSWADGRTSLATADREPQARSGPESSERAHLRSIPCSSAPRSSLPTPSSERSATWDRSSGSDATAPTRSRTSQRHAGCSAQTRRS